MKAKNIIVVRISELEKERTTAERELEKERALIFNDMVESFNCEITSTKLLEQKIERINRALAILYEVRDENFVISDLQEKTLAEQISQIKNKISELFANLADLAVIKNTNSFAHSLIKNGFSNDEQYDPTVCICDCHVITKEEKKHESAIPCCTVCLRCGKNINLGLMEAHEKICN
ncbi:MAG: hypothetical protein WC842_01115 [Candidatus Paceibacterota bacterium]|jgi:hypothetical protein